ncbi:TonB-dependent receptor domain-containing protein [Chitinophaga sp. HK235]|uniref:TonB-dependent receptor n=1 Tax=Chitinophaga sp. HK235 TaxID=2952571 RepID=UPI001BA89271|nr:TonB-dependent receptor [Chitinophaga sp. HK235]
MGFYKLHNILVVFVFSVLLPLAGSGQGNAKVYTLDIPAGTLTSALQYVSKVTGTGLTYNPADLSRVKVPARRIYNKPFPALISMVLQGTGYTASTNGEGYIIYAVATLPLKQAGTQSGVLTGRVVDEKGKPLEFASVQLKETGAQQTTNNDGVFVFRVPDNSVPSSLSISYVGKQTIETMVSPASYGWQQTFLLKELSLTLNGIHVNAVQKGTNSNSSMVFDREVIEQAQAFSLADILNTLPGREEKVPDLLNVQALTLRTAALNAAAANNSLGTAIIVDDIVRSNDANMQTKSLSMFGNTMSTVRKSGQSGFDVPFQGLDLRDIPVSNVERIEVVSGIASARYGDLTNGAVIIDRQAGATPLQGRIGINGYTTQYGIGKGFELGKKLGALNIYIDYLRSNADPRNLLQNYNRTNLDLMWTYRLSQKLKNTFSVSYNYRNDDIKMDPEDTREERVFTKTNALSISNRTSYNIYGKFLDNAILSMGFSQARQESYSQYAMNRDPRPIGDKDTTGIYEGYYIPGVYTAVDHILGKPNTASANLGFNGHWGSGKRQHQWSAGANVYISFNNGDGVVVDPATPRFVNQRYQNQRPYAYEYLPALVNTGFYIMDHIDLYPFNRKLSLNPGLRYDIQNGWGTLQPRINTSLVLSKRVTITMGYGLFTKAPGMSYRYPAPTYFDIPLLDVYNEDPAKRVYLVYTQKLMHDNSYLKPMKSAQLEWGLKYLGKTINNSLFVFYKESKDGFNTSSAPRQFELPEYDYKIENGKINYWSTGKTKLRVGIWDNMAVNDITTTDIGTDWTINTHRIEAIATSFNLSNAIYYSKYGSSLNRLLYKDESQLVTNGLWYGIFGPSNYEAWSFRSRLRTTTHIPKLGFIVNLTTNFSVYKRQRNIGNAGQPLGYVDIQSVYHDINELAPDSPIRQALGLFSTDESDNSDPFYVNWNMQVIKEIKKKVRFSVSAYNVFNIVTRKYSDISKKVRELTQPVVLSGEISFKF